MADILQMIFSQKKALNIEGLSLENLIHLFLKKLDLISESVENLPGTFLKSVKSDIVNELHNTMFRIQLNDSVDHCIEIIQAMQYKCPSNIQPAVKSVMEKLNMVKATWHSSNMQLKNNFTEDPQIDVAGITEEMSSAVYLSNCFIGTVDDLFRQILRVYLNTNHNAGQKLRFKEICEQLCIKPVEALDAEEINFNDSSKVSLTDVCCVDSSMKENVTQSFNEPEIVDVPMEIVDNDTEKAISLNNEAKSSDEAYLEEAESIMKFLLESLKKGSDMPLSQGQATTNSANRSTANNINSLQMGDAGDYHSDGANQTVQIGSCHAQYNNHAFVPIANPKPAQNKVLEQNAPHHNKTTSNEDAGSLSFEQQMDYYLRQLHPKTKEGVAHAVSRVAQFLHEEEAWAKKMYRRSKKSASNKPTRRSKFARPIMPADVQIYTKLGILSWDVKNKAGPPVDDSRCQFPIPRDVKASILRHRTWYPTMHDKLYCFENHSVYLFDIELFGCWECIRKYYNDIYKWASKIGLVLRQTRK